MPRTAHDPDAWQDPLQALETTGDLPVESFLTFQVNQLSSAFEREWSRFLRRQAGVSLGEWRLMAMLHHGPSTFARLVEATAMNKALAHRCARALADAELVEISATPGDGRSTTLALTHAGTALFERFRPRALERQRQLLCALTAQERRTLYRVLERLRAAALRWDPGAKD